MDKESKSNIKFYVIILVITGFVLLGIKMHNDHDTHTHDNGEVHEKH